MNCNLSREDLNITKELLCQQEKLLSALKEYLCINNLVTTITRPASILQMFELNEVRQTIARLIQRQVDIPAAKILTDTPIRELHPQFDSLSMIELQLLLEKEYEIQLSFGTNFSVDEFPKNTTELANQIIAQLQKISANSKAD